jgi:hypothetical protein
MTGLPPTEIANAIKQVLQEQISLPILDLKRSAAQLLGFSRMGSNVVASMCEGLNEAVKKGLCKIENGKAIVWRQIIP